MYYYCTKIFNQMHYHCAKCQSLPHILRWLAMLFTAFVDSPGFEPGIPQSKCGVLPLHYESI